jgi:predicted dehydrogenase
MKKLKVALIGHGHLGRWHLDKMCAHPNVIVAGVVEPSEKEQKLIHEKYPSLKVVKTLEELLPNIEAAIIATPTSFHFKIAKTLLENKKHVFCEKPITTTTNEAIILEKLAGEQGVVFQFGHSERFHQIWEILRSAEYKNFLSKPSVWRLNRLGAFKGRATDVDVVADLMIHDLDLLCWFLQEQPVTVKSIGKKIRTSKWDFVESTFEFKSKHCANIRVGRNHTHEVRDLEIINELGTIRVDLLNLHFYFASNDSLEIKNFPYEKRDHLKVEQEAFYLSILEGKPIVVDVLAGRVAMEMLEMVWKSLA